MNLTASSVWSKCLKFIKDNIQPQAYKTWFEPIKAVKLDEDICRRARTLKKTVIQLSNVKAIHSHGISKVKNVFKRVYLRTYYFTYDELYYFFKIGKNNSTYDKLKKNIKSYLFKFIFNIFLFRFSKSIYYFSKIKAFKDFSKKYDH